VRILLIAIGSHGDVHPFVGVGRRLRERGHSVTVIANELFKNVITGAGLEFAQLGTEAEYHEVAADPAMWGRFNSFKTIMQKGVVPLVRPVYDLVKQFASDDSVIVGSTLALGARIAEEKLGIRFILVHLSPGILRSEFESPVLPGAPIRPWMPRWTKRAFYAFADKLAINPIMRPELDAIRRELGLPPIQGGVWQWWHEAARIIGLWPAWFAKPQADWPPQLRVTGFPLFDDKDSRPMPPELSRFLDAGDPPIAFTAGSAMWAQHHFFEESAQACASLGIRGVLLCRHREHVPAHLPSNVVHVDYAPFSALLPRCAALAHHGGIGTTAQTLAAGIPQIIQPFAHDQLDNAYRVQNLGAGKWIEPRTYRARNVANQISRIFADDPMKRRCAEIRTWFAGHDPIAETCDLIEQAPPYPATASAHPSPSQTHAPLAGSSARDTDAR
jgi:rhamnosyltransferase subunit B